MAGYVVYRNNQQQILLAAKNTELNAANQAPDQLQITCLTVTSDNSHLSRSQYGVYSGYVTISEKFGVSNPTRFVMDVTWVLTIDFTAINLVTPSSTSFHLSANGQAGPIFPFVITGSNYNSLPPNPDFSKFIVTLDGTYAVKGTYGTYNPTQHLTYDSTANTGTGSLGSSGSLPQCT